MTAYFFQCNVFSGYVPCNCNIFVWNWSNTAYLFSAVDTDGLVLSTHPCVSSCLWANCTITFVLILYFIMYEYINFMKRILFDNVTLLFCSFGWSTNMSYGNVNCHRFCSTDRFAQHQMGLVEWTLIICTKCFGELCFAQCGWQIGRCQYYDRQVHIWWKNGDGSVFFKYIQTLPFSFICSYYIHVTLKVPGNAQNKYAHALCCVLLWIDTNRFDSYHWDWIGWHLDSHKIVAKDKFMAWFPSAETFLNRR